MIQTLNCREKLHLFPAEFVLLDKLVFRIECRNHFLLWNTESNFTCRYVAFVSGLETGSRTDNLLAIQLMIDLLTGQLGDEEQQKATASVVRLVVCGNSLSSSTQDKESTTKVNLELLW